ncbi:MAG: hypothetical protein PVH61_00125 [Candidatus Aminicenantes bacterium]|jgi:hypothetical protein
MARVEVVDYRGIKGILIDGHFPEFSFYKNIDWKRARKDKIDSDSYKSAWLVDYERYLKPEKPEPAQGTQSNFHRKLAANLRKCFCPYNKKPCAQFTYPARGVKPIERIIKLEKKKVREAVLPVFSREIEKEISEGNTNYTFNMAFLDLEPHNNCPIYEECNNNWIKFTGFEEKGVETYADFEAYKNAAETLLKSYMDFGMKVDWFRRRQGTNYSEK